MKMLGEFLYFALVTGICVLFLTALFVEMVSWYKADGYPKQKIVSTFDSLEYGKTLTWSVTPDSIGKQLIGRPVRVTILVEGLNEKKEN